jgi:dihydrodipicolinate synthase/N-acetylneuraminate lyase
LPAPFTGVHPVIQTPFGDDDSIDVGVLEAEIDWVFQQGAAGVVTGMVSEVLRMSSEERDDLTGLVCRFSHDHGSAIVSVGAESTATARRHARHAEQCGADAVMAIPPVSVGVDEAELRRYYTSILEAISIPVIVQDASGYVGRPMSLGLQAELFNSFGPQVMFKPEAVPIGPRVTELLDLTGGFAHVFEGTGGIALVDSFRRGAKATMPGADVCWAIVALWNALVDDDSARIDAINGPLASLISMQNSLDAFLAVEKHLLVAQGVFRNERVRGPVGYFLDDTTRAEVDRLVGLLRAAST